MKYLARQHLHVCNIYVAIGNDCQARSATSKSLGGSPSGNTLRCKHAACKRIASRGLATGSSRAFLHGVGRRTSIVNAFASQRSGSKGGTSHEEGRSVAFWGSGFRWSSCSGPSAYWPPADSRFKCIFASEFGERLHSGIGVDCIS